MARAPLKWTNVNSRDTSKILQNMSANAAGIGSSISNLGTIVSDFGTEKTGRETDAFIASIMGMEDTEARQAALANADKSFLNLGRITDKTYELGADERDLVKQLAREGRDSDYEEKINLREIAEANEEREKNEKRENFLIKMSDKREDEVRLMTEIQDENLLDKGFKQDKELIDIDFSKKTQINDLEFSRERSLITQRYKLEAKNAEAAAVTKAAGDQAVAKIEAERDIEIAKIEKLEKEALKQLEYQADLSEINAKAKVKEGSGINKIMKRYSVNGTIQDTDLDTNDVEAFSAANLEMVQNRGITQEQFDEFTGGKVNFVNRKLLGPNYFTFEFRGQESKFGKELFGVLGIGGNENPAMNALEAAILQSENDKQVYDTGFSAYKGLMKKEGITNVSESTYRAKWANYVQRIQLKPANVNEFLTLINEL